jgi:hypothetical protein
MTNPVDVVFKLGEIVLKVMLAKSEAVTKIGELGGPDEEIVTLQKVSKYWSVQNWLDRPDGLAIVTSHRFVFLSVATTITTTTDFLSFPVEIICNLRTGRKMLISPSIRFEANNLPFAFTFLRR